MFSKINLVFCVAVLFICFASANAQSTEFTYQGRLLFSDVPANGSYDFEFALFDAASGGNQLGSAFPLSAVNVNNGVFSVRIDFGNQFPGDSRFLEIHVRQAGSTTFAVLSPRQAISSAPYSIKSLNAANADTAANANQLGGVTANQFVVTSDARLSDSRDPRPNSGNYVQNSTSQQQGTNFNISGTGTADILSANTQFNIGNTKVLSMFGAGNLFVGGYAGNVNSSGINNTFAGFFAGGANTSGSLNTFVGNSAGNYNTTANNNTFVGSNAGQFTTTGNFNAFFGTLAGAANTFGNENAFFGDESGKSNTSGLLNSFFGYKAGQANSTAGLNSFFGGQAGSANTFGNGNSFFGNSAGLGNTTGNQNTFLGSSTGPTNTTGAQNTLIGSLADTANSGLTNASAIGSRAIVAQSNSLVLGSINGLNGATADTRVGIGTTQPAKHLHIFGAGDQEVAIQSSDSGGRMWTVQSSQGGSNGRFEIIDRTANASRMTIDLNGNVGIGTTAPSDKLHVNGNAVISGNLTVNGTTNLPITSQYVWNSTAQQPGGSFNISGDGTVAGTLTGNKVVAATEFDIQGARISAAGTNNLFAGASAGLNNTGFANSFFGALVGTGNTSGSDNTFVGTGVGFNTTSGSRNTFIGQSSGTINNTGTDNTALGDNANLGSSALSFAAAIGARSFVTTSDTIVLGKNAGTYNGVFRPADNVLIKGNLGVGTSSPGAPVHIAEGTTGVTPHVFATLVLERNGNNFLNILAPDANPSGIFFGNPTDGNFAGQFNYNDGVAPSGFTFRVNGGIARMVLTSGGNLGINTLAPADKLEVNGVLRVDSLGSSGSLSLCRNASNQISTCSSSIRYKKNVSSFTSGLDLVRRLRPVSFNWKADGLADFGLVAEEVNKIEPLLTTTNEKGQVEGVKYDRVGVVLVNAVNEQQAQIDNQQKQIDEQKQIIKRQQAEIDALMKLVCSRNRSAATCRSSH